MPPATGACTPWRLVLSLLSCVSMKCGRDPSIEARRWAGRVRLFWQCMTTVCFVLIAGLCGDLLPVRSGLTIFYRQGTHCKFMF